MLLNIAMMLVLVVGLARALRRTRAGKDLVLKLRSLTEMSGNTLVFPERLSFEKGTVVVTASFARESYPVHWSIKWIGEGVFYESMNLSTREVCFKAPTLVRDVNSFTAILPAFRVSSGPFKGLFVVCFSTENIEAESAVYIVSDRGFARGEVYLKRGNVVSRAEWVRFSGVETGARETLILEICRENKWPHHCMVLMRMNKPGVTVSRVQYPVISKIVIAGADGSGLEDLLGLVKEMPRFFSVERAKLRILLKRGLRVVANAEAPLRQA